MNITPEQYTEMCTVIDRAKMDDRSLDTDEYAAMILSALKVRVARGDTVWEIANNSTGVPVSALFDSEGAARATCRGMNRAAEASGRGPLYYVRAAG